tara:strand:- start:1613 stop:2362 length:750 start_codon:yes stop_codon:yes gene_type:complete
MNNAVAQSKTYELSWETDGYLLGAAMTFSSIAIAKEQRILSTDDLRKLNRLDINSFDRQATYNNSTTAASLSDVCRDAIVLVPLSLMAFKKARSEAGIIGLMFLETFAVTTSSTLAVKTTVRRVRPLAYNEDFSLSEKLKTSTSRSFFSGHTAHVSSLAFFSAKIINDLYPNSKYRGLAWAGAITIPAFAGYLRYRAGKHFPSDIFVGYGVGAALGVLVPQFHKIKNDKVSLQAIPLSDGAMVNLSLRF